MGSMMHVHLCTQNQESYALVNTILSVQPRMASSGGGKTNDQIVYELAESILGKVPEKLDLDKAVQGMFEVRHGCVHTCGVMCVGLPPSLMPRGRSIHCPLC